MDHPGENVPAEKRRHSSLCILWCGGIAVKALHIAMTAQLADIRSLDVVFQ